MSAQRSLRSEGGFGLIEVGIAAMLLSVFAAAFAGSLSAASNNLVENRTREQAAAVLSEEMEYMRSLAWNELAMFSVDVSAPMLNVAGNALSGSEAGLPTDETLHTSVSGLVTPSRVHSSEGIDYTAWRYVTEADNGLLRALVLVVWSVEGDARSLQSSTLVSQFTAGSGGSPTTAAAPEGDGGDGGEDQGDHADDQDDQGDEGDEAACEADSGDDQDGAESDHSDHSDDQDGAESDHDDDDKGKKDDKDDDDHGSGDNDACDDGGSGDDQGDEGDEAACEADSGDDQDGAESDHSDDDDDGGDGDQGACDDGDDDGDHGDDI